MVRQCGSNVDRPSTTAEDNDYFFTSFAQFITLNQIIESGRGTRYIGKDSGASLSPPSQHLPRRVAQYPLVLVLVPCCIEFVRCADQHLDPIKGVTKSVLKN